MKRVKSQGYKSNKDKAKVKGKKATNKEFKQHNLKDMEQFALCDAMRYVQTASRNCHSTQRQVSR